MKIGYDSKQRIFFCEAKTDYQRKSLRNDGFVFNPITKLFETRYIIKAVRLKEYFDDSAKNYIANLSIKNIKQPSRFPKPRVKKDEFEINVGDVFYNIEHGTTLEVTKVNTSSVVVKIIEENRFTDYQKSTIELLLKINVLTTKQTKEVKTMQPASVTFNLNEMDETSRATVLALLSGKSTPPPKGRKTVEPEEVEETEDFSSGEETELTLDDVKKACVAYVKKAKDVAKARKMISKKLSEYGAKETKDLDTSEYQDFIDSLS